MEKREREKGEMALFFIIKTVELRVIFGSIHSDSIDKFRINFVHNYIHREFDYYCSDLR